MRWRKDQGSVLIAVVVVLMLASMAALAVAITLQDYSRLQAKQRDELQAFHAAEAGAMEVVSWFNTSGTVISAINPWFASLFVRDGGSSIPYPALLATLQSAGSSGLDVSTQGDGLLPVLLGASGSEVAEVTSLYLYYTDYDPLAGEHTSVADVVAVVHSRGRTKRGSEKGVWMYLVPWWLEGAPAPIVSRAKAKFGGNAAGHWGEVWAAGKMETPLESQMKKYVSDDEWLKYRSESQILFDSTWGVPKWDPTWVEGTDYHKDPETGLDVVDVRPYQPADGVILKGVDYTNVFWQSQTLDWPDYKYERFERLSKHKGRYFSSDATGNLYRDGIVDADHLTTDPTDLNTGTMADRSTNPDVWAEVDYDVIFIDTIDGAPPAADGSNLATLNISGGDMSWKGFYYICANMRLTGSPTSAIPVKDPNGNYTPGGEKAFMDGILAVKGSIEVAGNPIVYGSVYADGGFSGGGTMDVYYNVELANGFPAPLHPAALAYFKVED